MTFTENEEKNLMERIKELETELNQLQIQLPAHSIKPEMVMRMEELEDELEQLRQKLHHH